ncbi:MAG: hypothetical protein AB1798_18310, partial [Spirochaetota bacterium]
MSKGFVWLIFALILITGLAAPLFSQIRSYTYTDFVEVNPNFPENVEVRRTLKDLIMESPNVVSKTATKVYFQLDSPNRVLFRTETANGALYLLFINEKDLIFPVYSAGSFVIKRRMSDGAFIQVKIFLKNDPECFARIFPMKDRTKMDVYLFGRVLYKNINIPIPFSEVLTSSLARIIELSKKSIDWRILESPKETSDQQAVQNMALTIRNKLPELKDADDGAMDRNGEFVYIETQAKQSGNGFNCSGFAKWVVDGIYYAETGKLIDLNLLKEKHTDLRDHRWSSRYEDERDPYFGLDWIRNLALAVRMANPWTRPGSPEESDVRNVPF